MKKYEKILNLINTQGNAIREQWDTILLPLDWEKLINLITSSIGEGVDQWRLLNIAF